MNRARFPFAPGVIEVHHRASLGTVLRGLSNVWRSLKERRYG